MANRFPLTLDGTTVKELPSGDNLDLTGSGIVNAGAIAATSVAATSVAATSVAVTSATVGGANALTTSSNLADLANVHTTTPTAGQLLAWDNTNTRWAAADPSAGGRWTQLASTTLNPSSPVQAVEFSSFVNSAYSEYEIRWSGFSTAANVTNEVDLYVQLGMTGFNSGAYQTSDYAFVNWYNKPDNVSATPLLVKNRTQGYFKLSQVYGQWNSTFPKSFGKINFTNDGSMISWECNMHAGERNSGDDARFALHRNWGLGYNWGSNGVRPIEKIKFYRDSSNTMQMGVFTLYGLAVT